MKITASELFNSLNLDEAKLAEFKQELLSYATNNLVKITDYIESPYMTAYLTDEVSI